MTAFLVLSTLSVPVHAAETATSSDVDTAVSENGKGDLQISITTPELLGAIPRGATRVEMATLNLSASCESDVTVTGIEVGHVGLGDTADITAVYMHDGLRRISRAKTFDRRSRTADLRLTSFTLRKCEARRLSVYVDIARDATVAAEHGVTIPHVSSITSSAKTTTLLRHDTTERVFTTPKDVGTITVNFLPISGPLRYGRTETVARLQLTADSQNDHLLQSIMFKNLGDARDMHLLNFTLETRTGTKLTPVAQRMRGLFVTLNFEPTYILERRRTVVFLLKAQINASQSKKVNFTIEEPSDLQSIPYRPSR